MRLMKWAVRALMLPMLLLGILAACTSDELPELKGRVNDYAELFTPAQRLELDGMLKAIEDKTTAQVVILTVKDLDRYGVGSDIAKLGIGLMNKWKPGQKGKDNGGLIIYTVKEDKYRIETGYGLEGVLPDGAAGNIIRSHLRTHADPKNGKKDFYGGFAAAVDAVTLMLTGKKVERGKDTPRPAATSESSDELFWLLAALVLLVAGFVGNIHPLAGGVVGGLGGWGLAYLWLFGAFGMAVIGVIGFLVGCIAFAIVDGVLSGGGSSGSGWSGSSSSSSGGFSGGGGSGGGGGATG